jgi:hypothetical protein
MKNFKKKIGDFDRTRKSTLKNPPRDMIRNTAIELLKLKVLNPVCSLIFQKSYRMILFQNE